MNISTAGRSLIILGIAIVAHGVAFLYFDKIPVLVKLPGDITVKWKDFMFYFPLITSILLSLFLTVIFLIASLFRR